MWFFKGLLGAEHILGNGYRSLRSKSVLKGWISPTIVIPTRWVNTIVLNRLRPEIGRVYLEHDDQRL